MKNKNKEDERIWNAFCSYFESMNGRKPVEKTNDVQNFDIFEVGYLAGQNESNKAWHQIMDEPLNSGDGTYRP